MVHRAKRNVRPKPGGAIPWVRAGQCDANHARMGHSHDVAAIVLAHVIQPALPAHRDHLCRFSAAGSIPPNVVRPGINLLTRDRVPSSTLPITEVHLDQVLDQRWLARRRKESGESHAPRGWAAIDAGARERFAGYLVDH